MGDTNHIQEFKGHIKDMAAGQVQVQTVWVTAEAIDWDKKTMTAKSKVDGLDYHDVQLGLGSRHVKPKKGAMCLIGIIQNKEAASYLIEAEAVEELVVTIGTSILTVTEEGFKMERGSESLTDLLTDLLTAQVSATYANSAGTTSPAVNVADFEAIKLRIPTLLK